MKSLRKRSKSREKDIDYLRNMSSLIKSDGQGDLESLPISSQDLVEDETSPEFNITERVMSRNAEDIDLVNDMNDTVEILKQDIKFNNTIDNNLGRILLELTAQINDLNKKTNLPKGKSVDETVNDFNEHLKDLETSINDNVNRRVGKIEDLVEQRVNEALQKHVREKTFSNYINHAETIFPPSFDCNSISVISDEKIGLINHTFPTRHKFSGFGTPSVVEFLRNMNAAQAQCKLSEHTFKETLLRCTTGEVYDSVATMVDGNISLSEIYNALLTKYDTRLRPEHAQLELENFVLPKDPTFNKVVSKIMALCQRACLEHGEPARTQIYNLTAIGYLLKNLPYGSINDGLKIRADLITELGRFPTFAEVVQALRKYVGAIDLNYRRDDNRKRYSRSENLKASDIPVPKFSVRNNMRAKISEINHKQNFLGRRNDHNFKSQSYNNTNPTSNRYNGNQQKYNNNNNSNYRDHRKQNPNFIPLKDNSKINNSRNNDNNTNRKDYGIHTEVNGRLRCNFCGKNTHAGSKLCYEMRNDEGIIKFTIPTSEPCLVCKKEIGKTLYHPSYRCFNRPVAKQLKMQGKWRYPSAEERRHLDKQLSGNLA